MKFRRMVDTIKSWKKTWKKEKVRGKVGKCSYCGLKVKNLQSHLKAKHKKELQWKKEKEEKTALRDFKPKRKL